MKIKKITQLLILISILAVIFDIARLDLWGTTDLLYLIWNLFLAWIPYIISSSFIKENMGTIRFSLFFILWILVFPNAPYLVTDVLHIVSRAPTLLWYDSLLFFFFGWIGLFLGILSLLYVHQYFRSHLNYWVSEIIVFAICLISSFGIYLGRFERWNSWDIFFNPFQLMKHSFDILISLIHMETPLMFVVVFSIFIYSIYKTVYILITESNSGSVFE